AIYDFGKRGSDVRKISAAYDSLCDSVDASSDKVLESLKDISGGAVAEVDVMKNVSQAIKLMGEDAITSLPDMMAIAVASANSTGESVTKSFSDVITATSRQSIEILDNVGISATTTRKYIEEYAAAHGTTAEKLDASAKKAAFFYAVNKAGGDIIKAQGGNLQEMISGFDKLSTAATNFSNALSTGAFPALDAFATRLAEMLDDATLLARSVGATGRDKLVVEIDMAKDTLEEYQKTYNELKEKNKSVLGDFFHVNADDYLNDVLNPAIAKLKEAQAALDQYDKAHPQKKTGGSKKTGSAESGGGGGSNTDWVSDQKALVDDRISIEDTYWQYVSSRQSDAVSKEYDAAQEIQNQQMALYEQSFISFEEFKRREAEISEEYQNRQVLASVAAAEQERQASESLMLAKAGFRSTEYSATGQMLDNLSSLMQAKDKRLFQIGKVAAIGRAVMNVAEGVTKALSYGPILGPALAATVVAAGAVQIANIKSQSYGSSSSSSSKVSTSSPSETDTTSDTTESDTSKSINLYGKNLEQFAVGTWNVPSDMYAQIHKGEVITPKTFSDSLRAGDAAMVTPEYMSQLAAMLAQNSGGDTNIIVQGSVVDAQGLLDIVDTQRAKKARNLGTNDYQAKSVYV
ncbi:MAG: hypothetical protein ACRCUT_12565, partial [Spirochaetota bacterium]